MFLSKIKEEYGLEPEQLIEVKALQGDTSDNIPGVPGIGEKTALSLIQRYGSIENLYEKIENGEDDLKGKQKEAITTNKELAYLSKTLGTINTEVPLEDNLETLKVEEWDRAKVLEIFKNLNFKKYIERFNLNEDTGSGNNSQEERTLENLFQIVEGNEAELKKLKEIVYYLEVEEDNVSEKIIKKKIKAIAVYNDGNVHYLQNPSKGFLKEIFENENIKKYGHNLTEDYIILKQEGIRTQNLEFDSMVAAYILNPTVGKYKIADLINEYLELDLEEYLKANNVEVENAGQITLFQDEGREQNTDKYKTAFFAYGISDSR